MSENPLLIPVYCPNCDNLSYLLLGKTGNREWIEYTDNSWQEHVCVQLKGSAIWDEAVIKERSGLKCGLQRIPFEIRQVRKSFSPKELVEGVVLSLYQKDQKGWHLQVLTTKETIIEIRTLTKRENLSAGMFIVLKGMVRTGIDKYRLGEIIPADLPEVGSGEINIPQEYYQLTLSATDPALLETYTDRFLQFFVEQKTPAFSVIPKKIEKDNSSVQHQREIKLCPGSDLMRKFKDIPLPDTIQVSMKQMKG